VKNSGVGKSAKVVLGCITKKRACSGRSAIMNRHEHGALRQS
jgi:hypothetical protein